MSKVTYEKEITALLVIDPYNDFISEGGKVWDRLKGVAKRIDAFLTPGTWRAHSPALGTISPDLQHAGFDSR